VRKLDTAVVGGLVASSSGVERLDLGIKDGKIVERSASIDGSTAERVIDASGRYVLPGAIDAHLHPQYGDNLAAGSIAAAFGGITTVVPFVYAYKGLELGQAIDEFLEGDGAHSVIDYGLHLGVVNPVETRRADPRRRHARRQFVQVLPRLPPPRHDGRRRPFPPRNGTDSRHRRHRHGACGERPCHRLPREEVHR